MLLLSSIVLAMSGVSPSTLWTQLPLAQMDLVLLYTVIVIALWHAPIYAWLLLVSGWARRATFLWAVLPPIAIAVFQAVVFRLFDQMGMPNSEVGSLPKGRLFGWMSAAFDYQLPGGGQVDPHFVPLTQIAVGKFLSSPGLWVGLAFAAGFLALAVSMRRDRESM
jgi:ABC-2 type transport system permease protein